MIMPIVSKIRVIFFISDSFPMHWWFQRLENDVWLCVITDQLRLLERHEMELLHKFFQMPLKYLSITKIFLHFWESLEEMGDFPNYII